MARTKGARDKKLRKQRFMENAVLGAAVLTGVIPIGLRLRGIIKERAARRKPLFDYEQAKADIKKDVEEFYRKDRRDINSEYASSQNLLYYFLNDFSNFNKG